MSQGPSPPSSAPPPPPCACQEVKPRNSHPGQGALGKLEGLRSNWGSRFLLPSSERCRFPKGVLVPSPFGCGILERTKECYHKLRSLGRGGGRCRSLRRWENQRCTQAGSADGIWNPERGLGRPTPGEPAPGLTAPDAAGRVWELEGAREAGCPRCLH